MRRPTLNDLEAALRLTNTCEIALDGVAETTLYDMHDWWQTPDFDLGRDAWLVFTYEGQLVACSSVVHNAHMRIHTSGDVHPGYRGRGIGSYLLGLVEARAREHIALAEPGARVVLFAHPDVREVAELRLLEKAGFTQIRGSWRMGIELNEAPTAPVWSQGIKLRTLAGDMDLFRAVYEADEEVFQDHWGYIPTSFDWWKHWTIEREGFDPTLWFLAMDGGEIAAFALCQDEKGAGGWVHSLGVRRPWRRRGLGEALLHRAFGEFYRRGIHHVYLSVDAQNLTGATRLYERVGMHIVKQYRTYEKELRPGKELSTQSLTI
jgi:ribosomal protein S18 acetylase RimI-like enzyme